MEVTRMVQVVDEFEGDDGWLNRKGTNVFILEVKNGEEITQFLAHPLPKGYNAFGRKLLTGIGGAE